MSTLTTTIDHNKSLVTRFVADVWNARKFDRLKEFVAEAYVQHNPNLPNGRAALDGFLRGFYSQNMANGEFAIARIVADGDLIITHSLFKTSADDRGTAVVGIYRVEDGLLVEHWDVKEPVPEATANGNPMV